MDSSRDVWIFAALTAAALAAAATALLTSRSPCALGADAHALRRRSDVAVALLLRGSSPALREVAARRHLACATWPSSVRVVAAEVSSADEIRRMCGAHCRVLVLAHADIDLLPCWDQLALEAVEAQPGAVLSHFVQTCGRLEQWTLQNALGVLALPRCGAEGATGFAVPDYRLFVSDPTLGAQVAETWFDSFWWGLAAAAAAAPQPVTLLSVTLAVDGRESIGAEAHMRLDSATAASLLVWLLHAGASGAYLALLGPWLWPGKPRAEHAGVHMHLPRGRRLLCAPQERDETGAPRS